MSAELNLELAWRRLVWEVTLDPFQTPDAFTQPSFLRRQEVLASPPERVVGNLRALLERGAYRPEPFEPMLTSRGPGARAMACLSVRDNLLMLALLASASPKLLERFAPTDGRSDLYFRLNPDLTATDWLRAPLTEVPFERAGQAYRARRRQFFRETCSQGGWTLRVDVSSCGPSLDYRRLLAELALPRAQARLLLSLLQTLRLGPRHGLRSFGNCLGILVKAYLNPVVRELARRGHRFFLTDLDEFHLFAPTRGQLLSLLEELEELLLERGLSLNHGKARLGPARPTQARSTDPALAWLLGRLPAWPGLARLLAPMLRNDRYTSRGPAFRDLLHAELWQQAALVVLRDPRSRPGDRYQVLYWLAVAGVRARGELARYLAERLTGAGELERNLLRGALGARGEAPAHAS